MFTISIPIDRLFTTPPRQRLVGPPACQVRSSRGASWYKSPLGPSVPSWPTTRWALAFASGLVSQSTADRAVRPAV